MKKLFIGILLSVFLAVWFLQRLEAIGFGVPELLARSWPIIPLWMGTNYFKMQSNRSKKTGLVLILFSGFWLILNLAILFTQDQTFVYIIAGMAFLFFWPVTVIMLFFHIIFSFMQKGEMVLSSVLRHRVVEGMDWEKEDTSLIGALGVMTLKLKSEDIQFRTVRLDTLAILGKVVVEVPEGVSVLAEAKTRIGCFNILGQPNRKIIGRELVEEDVPGQDPPRLLFTSSSWLGRVEIRRL